MKIKKIDLTRLENDGYAKFHNEVRDLILEFGARELDIEDAFDAYMICYGQFHEALHIVRKNIISDEMKVSDKRRNAIFRGLVDAVKSGLNHFNPVKAEAARRFKIALDQDGNIARRGIKSKTAALMILVSQARNLYPDEINTLGIADWIDELELRNMAYYELEMKRNSEWAALTKLRTKPVRVEMDAAYRTLTTRIDALIVLAQNEYAPHFARKLNLRIDSFKLAQAQKEGRARRKKNP